MHKIRRSVVALAMTSVVLTLAGCGDDPSARPEYSGPTTAHPAAKNAPSAQTAPTEEAAPTDKAPDKSDAEVEALPTRTPPPVGKAKVVPGESAEDFIRRWYKVYAQMQNTGDSREYLGMAKKCGPCKETAATIQEFYRLGGYVKTEGDEITLLEPAPKGGKNAYRVGLKTKKTQIKMAKEAPLDESNPPPVEYIVFVEKDGQTWQVVNYTYPDEL